MSFRDTNSALTQAYIDAGLGLPTAYEGVEFIPPSDADWAAFFVLPAANEVFTLGVGGQDEEEGIAQIDLNTPQGLGTDKLLDWADTLQSAFVAGQSILYNGHAVWIRQIERIGIRPDGGWLRLTINVTWYTRYTRPAI